MADDKYRKHVLFMEKCVDIGAKIVKKNELLRIIDKGDSDVVTNVDLEIETKLIKKVKATFPRLKIVSEESNRGKELPENCFVIDPIDGTKNFCHTSPLWGLQMAYLEKGIPVASVLYCPELGIKVSSSNNSGTRVNSSTSIIDPKNLEHCMVVVDGPKAHRWRVASMLDNTLQGVRLLGSTCVGFSLVISGKIDGYVYMCKHPWDLLPGLCACKNAGLFVYDRKQTMAIVANSSRLLNYLKTVILEELKLK